MEHDLFDFLLLSLPDNDTYSHRNGPSAQVTSLAEADRQLERLIHAAGGPDAFLEEHAVIVCSDHSQSKVEAEIDLFAAFDGFDVVPADGAKAEEREIALCPASRSAQVYLLDTDAGDELRERVVRTALALEGVDLVMHRTDHPDGEAIVRAARGELRFRPGGDLVDLRGDRWSVDGDLGDARARHQRRPRALGELPGRAGADLGRPALPPVGELLLSARSPGSSSPTGAARTTSAAARTARCTSTTPTACCCGRAGTCRPPTRASSGPCATSRR